MSILNVLTKTIKYTTALATVLVSSPLATFAQADPKRINLNLPDSSEFSPVNRITATGLLQFVINAILIVAAVVAFIFLLIGGAQWVLAGGDKEGTEKARKRITHALIGLAVTFSAYAIAFLVEAVFGFSILNFQIPTIVR